MREVLGGLARRQHDGMVADACIGQARLQFGQMVMRDDVIGNNDGLLAAHQRQDLRAGACDQAGADEDVVAARVQFDAQALDRAMRVHAHLQNNAPSHGGDALRSTAESR